MVGEAKRLEEAGAALLNFTNSGPVVGPAVAQAVSIPVLGGFGGGPWLDGRVRMATAAIGYSADALDNPPDTYANVAQIALDAITAYAGDVRCGAADRRWDPAVSVSTAVIDGILTRYRWQGSGPPLLMFSPGGFGASMDSWDKHGLVSPHPDACAVAGTVQLHHL